MSLGKDETGRYITTGLSPKEFNRVFNKIAKDQNTKRRKAHRTLTPALIKNKDLEKFLALGKKKDGTLFTPEDLKAFDQSRRAHRKAFSSDTQGITYSQLVALSTKIDIDRANNNVNDGSGISSASFAAIKHNLAIVQVKASSESVHQHHRVRIRFEEWDLAVETAAGEASAAKRVARNVCKGRVSIDCDCGRHQYWYRYMATAGNYALPSPKEYAYPKVRNPDLTGVACKHVIHALTRFQSAAWQLQIAKRIESDAHRVGFGDDKKRTTKFFSEEEQKSLNKNRKSNTDQKKSRAEFALYQKRQDALGKKLERDSSKIDELRTKLKKTRNNAVKDKERLKLAEEKIKKLEAEKQSIKDEMKMRREAFVDAAKMGGMSQKDAEKAFETWFKNKMMGG